MNGSICNADFKMLKSLIIKRTRLSNVYFLMVGWVVYSFSTAFEGLMYPLSKNRLIMSLLKKNLYFSYFSTAKLAP